MELVAFVGQDKESLGQVSALINRMECEKVILVKDKGTEKSFQSSKCRYVDVDGSKGVVELKEDILSKIRKELSAEFEVALSLASGNGKENMALISALLSVPVGVRIVAFTKKGVEFLT